MSEQKETPRDELAEQADAHYEKISQAAFEYNNVIPKAIQAWVREPDKDAEIKRLKQERNGWKLRHEEMQKMHESAEAFATAEIEGMQTQIDAAQTRVGELEVVAKRTLEKHSGRVYRGQPCRCELCNLARMNDAAKDGGAS